MNGPPEPSITAHEIVVSRTARYFTLGPTHGFPREIWLVCHGYGQLASRFIAQFVELDDGTRLVVAPEALSRFYLDPISERRTQRDPRVGATWMTREHRLGEITDYVSYLEQLTGELKHRLMGAAPRLVVLGFSQGTATVCRWADASAYHVDELVLWGGGIPPELDLSAWSERLRGTPLTLVAGDADEFMTSAAFASEAERLSAAGVAHTLQRYAGKHEITPEALETLAASFAGR